MSLGEIVSGTGSSASEVQIADMNSDGRADYLMVADNSAVNAWLNWGGE